MKKIEKYTGKKTYMFPNGQIATPEAVHAQFPAATAFVHIVETDESGEVMWAFDNLSARRHHCNVDSALTESESIAAIEALVNAPLPEPEPSVEERQAAALEMIALNGMPNIV